MRRKTILIALTLSLTLLAIGRPASAEDEGWTIRSFDVSIVVSQDGRIAVTEEIAVDFGALERHGIFRDTPLRYVYDGENDRVTPISDVTVDDGSTPTPYSSS